MIEQSIEFRYDTQLLLDVYVEDGEDADDVADDLVDEIRRTERKDGGNFDELAGWVDLVREDGDFSDDEGAPNAEIVNQLKKNLPKATKLADVLNNADYRRILYLDPYEVQGVSVDVCNDIRDYFNGKRKRSPKYSTKNNKS